MWRAGLSDPYAEALKIRAAAYEPEQHLFKKGGAAAVEDTKKIRKRLFPALLALFILEILLLPVMITLTYPTRSVNPEHILTYTPNLLRWDGNTEVRADGTAELSFFETLYQNANDENADKILVPGTEKESLVRFVNKAPNGVRYTAVAYVLKTDSRLPVTTKMSGDGFSDTTEYALPNSIAPASVIRAVSGSVPAGGKQDFDIDWSWTFEDKTNIEARDRLDTYLGNLAADGHADQITIGFYLVVEAGGSTVKPAPRTGDSTPLWGYVSLMAISGAGVVVTAVVGRRRKENET